ncbi:winged helix DNA-binding protein [Streptomyces cinnamoneus]|uniref:winged helix DNA-binding protein n=1 Tax=Streptomyces cinnamoneus TaxID=53446 RepID=UPI0011B06886|nr:winged helix DNA-binding protein [Streptomyces cinnamoneus]
MRVHRNRHDRAFVVVPNAAARHDRLSLAAVGLLVRLLSLPDGTAVTIEKITEQVDEGKTAVAKAFKALEEAGYLRRQRSQDRDTGRWYTQTHVSDIPMTHIPAVGEPEVRSVGDLPKGEKHQVKNLLPKPSPKSDGQRPDAAGTEEEEIKSQDEQAQAAPADAETGRAAAVLAKLGDNDRRLGLGTADVLRLAPLAAEWLAEGHSQAKLLAVLTARLPERIDSPAALVAYRLKTHRPAHPAPSTPKPAPAPDTRARCQQCDAPFPAGVIHSLCKTCTAEARRDQAATVGGDAAGLLSAIRQRRESGAFAKGAKSRFIPAAA